MDKDLLNLRFDLNYGDDKRIREITQSVSVFNAEEIDIAEELAIESIEKGADKSGYHFIVYENSDSIIGFTCYGEIPGTKNRYDLYWIVISRELRGCGIGKKLIYETEKTIMERGGKKIFAETSSKDSYYGTRQFYMKCGYFEVVVIKDFYDDGDDKIVYLKNL